MKRHWLLIPMLAAASMVGCAGGYAYYAPAAPPPPRFERYGVAPGPGYVWVTGRWAYRGGGYAWAPGYWSRPPRGRRAWEEGRWEHRGNRYYYRDGRWR